MKEPELSSASTTRVAISGEGHVDPAIRAMYIRQTCLARRVLDYRELD